MALAPIIRSSFFDLFSFWYVHYCKCNEANYLCHPSSAATTRHRQNGKPQGVGRRERLCGALTLFSHFLCFWTNHFIGLLFCPTWKGRTKVRMSFWLSYYQKQANTFLVTWSFPNNPNVNQRQGSLGVNPERICNGGYASFMGTRAPLPSYFIQNRNLLSFFCRIITFQMLEEEKALSNTAAVVVSLLMIVSSKKKTERRMYLACASWILHSPSLFDIQFLGQIRLGLCRTFFSSTIPCMYNTASCVAV